MRRTLGDLLVEESFLDEEGLQVARREARRSGLPLVVWVTQEGRVSEHDLAEMLERRLKIARVDLAQQFVDPEAVREVPYDVAEGSCVLPLSIERSGARHTLRVAMADPLDAHAVEEIEVASGCRVEPAVATPSEIQPLVQKHYRGVTTKLIHRNERPPSSPPTDPGGTVPYRRIDDDAPVELKVRALVALLLEKGLLDEEEWIDAVKRLLKEG